MQKFKKNANKEKNVEDELSFINILTIVNK